MSKIEFGKENEAMKTKKKVLASLMLVMTLVVSMMIGPVQVNAAATEVDGANGVKYILDEENYDFASLWAERKAPTKAGYVFGGWYTRGEGNSFTAIKEEEGEQYTEAYAKFVPAEVLSVRAQLDADTEDANGVNVASTYLRLLTGVNGLSYKKAGFDIKYNKKVLDPAAETSNNITTVFKKITNKETGAEGIAASAVFGNAATHFVSLRLEGIGSVNFNKVIYVTPHWTTLDGTYVEGQAKYVRVMDGFADNHYISVPVNFVDGAAVAAGQVQMSYDSNALEFVGFDKGILMTEMEQHDNKAGKIQIVGNIASKPADGAKGVEPTEDIFANVWFKVKDGVDASTLSELTFTVQSTMFCDWDEDLIDVTPWSVKYFK